MGDLEYVEGKVVSGDYWDISGDINAVTDTIEFVPANGKTALMIEAHVSMTSDNNLTTILNSDATTVNKITANFQIDGVEKDRLRIGNKVKTGDENGVLFGSAVDNFVSKEQFSVLGKSLIGDGIKKIEIENILDSGSAFAAMSGYVRDT